MKTDSKKAWGANLRELVGHHVPNSPGLVFCCLAQRWHDQGLQILLRQQSGDADTGLHRKQPHRVLIIQIQPQIQLEFQSQRGQEKTGQLIPAHQRPEQ